MIKILGEMEDGVVLSVDWDTFRAIRTLTVQDIEDINE